MFNPDVHSYQTPAREFWDVAAAQSAVELIAAVANRRIVIDTIIVSIGTATSQVTFESETVGVGPAFNMGINTTQWITDLNLRLAEGENFEFSSTGTSTGCVYVEWHLESGNV